MAPSGIYTKPVGELVGLSKKPRSTKPLCERDCSENQPLKLNYEDFLKIYEALRNSIFKISRSYQL